MIYFLKHFKGIAYFLSALILFQSCVVYQKTPSTIEQASSNKDMPIKITTKDGKEYKLRWIEEKDGKVYSIKKTRIKFIDKKDIDKILIYNPKEMVVPLEEALNHEGTVLLRTTKFEDQHPYKIDSYIHSFMKIVDEGDYIKGYKMTGKDTVSVTIPIDQIEKILLKDKDKSNGATLGATIGITFGVGIVTFIIAYIITMRNAEW